jgi:3-hydroxyisobutyrate dehydrogenase
MAEQPVTIAVLGAGGTMGLAMARNLARAGFDVRGWNRSAEKAAALREDGATVAATPAEAAAGARVVLTMLSDTDAVLGTMDGEDGALAAMDPDAVWVQASTIGLDGTDRCRALAAARGIAYVDAPVLGTKAPAEAGKLTVLASGDRDWEDRLAPVFDAVGQRTVWLGDGAEATRLKLVVNAWVISVVEGVAEALALAEGLGLDPALLLDMVAGGPLDAPYVQLKGKSIIDRDFTPSFSLRLAAKDAALVRDAAGAHGLDLPMLAAIADRLAEGVPEHGDEDLSATWHTSAPRR